MEVTKPDKEIGKFVQRDSHCTSGVIMLSNVSIQSQETYQGPCVVHRINRTRRYCWWFLSDSPNLLCLYIRSTLHTKKKD